MDMRQGGSRRQGPGPLAGGVPPDPGATAFGSPEHLDTLLEAHASIVSEIRARVSHSDIDGSELVTLAQAVAALDAVIELVADGGGWEANAPARV